MLIVQAFYGFDTEFVVGKAFFEEETLVMCHCYFFQVSTHHSLGLTHQREWKPFTLKFPYLASVTIIFLALAATLEYLSRRSSRNGGLVFAEVNEVFTTLQSFSILYLPTIIAVGVSILWSWVDLDTKRLEPYFQLSQPKGALAEHSLLLRYPMEYLPLVPLKAARLR